MSTTDLPLLALDKAPIAAWPYAGGILLWKDVVDFFDNAEWVRSHVERLVNKN